MPKEKHTAQPVLELKYASYFLGLNRDFGNHAIHIPDSSLFPNVGNSEFAANDHDDRVPEQCLSEPSTTCMVNNHDMEFSHDAAVRRGVAIKHMLNQNGDFCQD